MNRYYYVNGNFYQGEWRDDKKDGRGIYQYNITGEKYEGEWKGGERHGKGIYYFSFGDTYNGQ